MKNQFITITLLVVFLLCMTWNGFAQTEDEMKAVLQGIHEAHNAHDMDQYLTYFTEDAMYEGHYLSGTLLDRDGQRELFEDLFHAYPDNHVDNGLVLFSDNILIQEHNMIGTGVNDFRDLPASGKEYIWPHIDIMEFEGNKVKKYITYGDYTNLMILSGLIPQPQPIEFEPSLTLPEPEPSESTPTEIVMQTDELWNSKDMNSYAKYFNPDADLLIVSLGVPLNRDEYIAAQDIYIQAFSDRQLETVRMLDCGEGWIVSELVFRGIHNGPFMGIPATNKPFEIHGINITHVNEEGLITYLHNYYDNMLLLAQLGLLQTESQSHNWELYN
jgi:steroid delta-isomerase-like uncharacterized protein